MRALQTLNQVEPQLYEIRGRFRRSSGVKTLKYKKNCRPVFCLDFIIQTDDNYGKDIFFSCFDEVEIGNLLKLREFSFVNVHFGIECVPPGAKSMYPIVKLKAKKIEVL